MPECDDELVRLVGREGRAGAFIRRRNGDVHTSSDWSRIVIARRYRLITGRDQSERESVRTGVGGGKHVEGRQAGRFIGGREMDRAVNDCVALAVIHGSDRSLERLS